MGGLAKIMCAIAGVFCRNNKLPVDILQGAVHKMNQAQARRGPDDQGVFSEAQINADQNADKRGLTISENQRRNPRGSAIVLGNCRLAIIDLSSAGHQPMHYKAKDGRAFWITFNGEIYNFEELKRSLTGKGYVFKTHTDTEVIQALFAEYGEASFRMLRGMFAFALFDVRAGKLFLVKDYYGIKPLYYFKDNEKVVFASTIGALLESGLVPREKNPKALISFLLLGSVPLPLTTIKNVFGLEAGHYLVIEKDKDPQKTKYYDPLDAFFEKKDVDFNSAVSEVKRRLEDSVKHHLISDAPLGVFLSGGLDSSALSALAAHLSTSDIDKLITLSVVFDEKEFSEEYHSDRAAQKIGSDHRKIKITKEDFYNSFEEIFRAMDQPTIDGINTFFVSWAAKKAGLKAVLSGLGGDEVFCGYPAFRRAALVRYIQKFPLFIKSPLTLFSFLGDRFAKLAYFSEDDILSFYLMNRGLFSPDETAKLLGISQREVTNVIRDDIFSHLRAQEGRLQKLHPVDLLSYFEITLYLQNQLLKDTDFMSMYHSVEVRVPFLDRPLVEYVASLDPKMKISKKINKPLLAEAVRDIVPQEILTRKKMGFTFPFAEWLKEDTDIDYNDDFIAADLAIKFKAGKLHWSRFWALAILAKVR